MDRFAFEVITEAPVSEHLEERVMARRPAHFLEVIVFAGDTQATLVVHRADIASLLPAGQDVLELDHSGVSEEQRLVPRRQQRGARHLGVAALEEELDELAANLSRCEVGNRQVRHLAHGTKRWAGGAGLASVSGAGRSRGYARSRKIARARSGSCHSVRSTVTTPSAIVIDEACAAGSGR